MRTSLGAANVAGLRPVACDSQEGEIARRVGDHHGRVARFALAVEPDVHRLGIADDMCVGHDLAVGGDDQPGAQALAGSPVDHASCSGLRPRWGPRRWRSLRRRAEAVRCCRGWTTLTPKVDGFCGGADRCWAHCTPISAPTRPASHTIITRPSTKRSCRPGMPNNCRRALVGRFRLVERWRADLRGWEVRFDDDVLSAHRAPA